VRHGKVGVEADAGIVDRDGFMLTWAREGRGLPMMVLGALRFYPRYFPRSLREHFEIVFCDLRQWVRTPDGFDIGTVDRDTFSEDVEALRKAAGLDRPIVVGQSQHGAIALEYARRFPGSVRGVVAIAAIPPAGSRDGLEAAADFFERDADADRKAAHRRNRETRRVPVSIETTEDFVDDYVADGATGWYDPTFDSSPLWEGVEVNLQVMDQVFEPEAFGGYQVEPLDVPVFLALGRYDYGIPYFVWDEPRKRFSNLRYRLYDKSGHHPPYEQPDEFTADLLEWAHSV
jgi:proline iminopeptidase